MKVTIYGASDDLCEVEGDLREEFDNCADGSPFWLVFAEGTIVGVQYNKRGDGTWQVWREREGTAVFTMEYVADEGSEDRGEGYTDRATLEGDLVYVGRANRLPKPKPAPPAPEARKDG